MNNDAGTMAERYKQELMKLYRGHEPENESPPEPTEAKETIAPEETVDETTDESADENTSEPANEECQSCEQDISGDIEQNFPEPDISELNNDEIKPEYIVPSDIGNSEGYILVNVRTGGDALPIESAAVTVTAIVNGTRLIIAAAPTDISGATIKLKVPAPDIIYSQAPDPRIRPYSLFDVTVAAKGFFNARSVDIPVFPGITSIQNFSMIPVPLYMKSSDETLTYYNQEPDL